MALHALVCFKATRLNLQMSTSTTSRLSEDTEYDRDIRRLWGVEIAQPSGNVNCSATATA